jgi:hypothetical protein
VSAAKTAAHLLTEGHFALWDGRAELLVEHALAEWDEVEQHGTLALALACLNVATGDLPPDEFEGYTFPGEVPAVECICPPELLARGGFKGDCPARGVAHG